jgi:hypothetical protein
MISSWFGKKAAEETVKGVGSWIDEQQLTKEEQIKYKLHLFEVMGPFKQIQRIIVTWVMYVWAAFSFNFIVAFWLGVIAGNWTPIEKLIEVVSTPFIWTPCLGVFTLYLSGGLKMFKGSKTK